MKLGLGLTDSDDELLDLVDQNDQVIGYSARRMIYAQQLSNFRVVNAFLINDRGQVWIPRRTKSKKLFPLCLDTSVGGHVMVGESYKQAFRRELQEELNLDLSQVPFKFLFKLVPHEQAVSAFMHVYLIKTNQAPNYNQDDFVSASWYDLAALQSLIKQGEPTKGDLPILLNMLQKADLSF